MKRPKSSKEANLAMLEIAKQLCAALPGFRSKSMFGGYGLWANECMFGLIAYGQLFLRIGADEELRRAYEEQGSVAFMPKPNMQMTKWWSVPTEHYDDERAFQKDARIALKLMADEPARPSKRKGAAPKGAAPRNASSS